MKFTSFGTMCTDLTDIAHGLCVLQQNVKQCWKVKMFVVNPQQNADTFARVLSRLSSAQLYNFRSQHTLKFFARIRLF